MPRGGGLQRPRRCLRLNRQRPISDILCLCDTRTTGGTVGVASGPTAALSCARARKRSTAAASASAISSLRGRADGDGDDEDSLAGWASTATRSLIATPFSSLTVPAIRR